MRTNDNSVPKRIDVEAFFIYRELQGGKTNIGNQFLERGARILTELSKATSWRDDALGLDVQEMLETKTDTEGLDDGRGMDVFVLVLRPALSMRRNQVHAYQRRLEGMAKLLHSSFLDKSDVARGIPSFEVRMSEMTKIY